MAFLVNGLYEYTKYAMFTLLCSIYTKHNNTNVV